MAKTSSLIGCREKQTEWKKCVDGLRAVLFKSTAFVYGSLYSAAPSAVSIIVLEHRGNKTLELCLRTRELFVIFQQNKCILIYSKLGCSWTTVGRYEGLNGLLLLNNKNLHPLWHGSGKRHTRYQEKKKAAINILQKPGFSSVWVFLNVCDLEGNGFGLYLVLVFLWKLHHSALSGFSSYCMHGPV